MQQVKLLIIDDEVNIAKTLSASFDHQEFYIECCGDGIAGWKMLESGNWDIVILDFRLPGMNGLEILQKMYENNVTTKVIMITAYGTINNAVEAMKYGAVDYIQKPFDPSTIRSTVFSVLERFRRKNIDAKDYHEHFEQAKLSISNRDYRTAKQHLKSALDIKPESAEAYNLLGAVFEVMGDKTSAVQAYQMALQFDSNFPPALDNLKRITSMESNALDVLDVLTLHNKDKYEK